MSGRCRSANAKANRIKDRTHRFSSMGHRIPHDKSARFTEYYGALDGRRRRVLERHAQRGFCEQPAACDILRDIRLARSENSGDPTQMDETRREG
jgi:hypothetical protein